MGISLANMLGPISYRLKSPGMPSNGEGGTWTVVVNKEREWQCGSIDVTDVTVGIRDIFGQLACESKLTSEAKRIALNVRNTFRQDVC